MYSIGQFAALTGVTERALRYYDRKNLLKPTKRNEHGYRFYTERDLVQLQNILAMKYLDYSLDDIADYLNKSGEDLVSSLAMQTNLLETKMKHLEQILKTIRHVKAVIGDDQKQQTDRDLLLALIYSIHSEKELKKWMSDHVSESFIGKLYMEEKSEEERIESEKKMIRLFADMKRFYHEGRSSEDELVQKKALEFITLLSTVIKQENLAEIEKLAEKIDEKPQFHPSLVDREVEAYMTEVLRKMKDDKMSVILRSIN